VFDVRTTLRNDLLLRGRFWESRLLRQTLLEERFALKVRVQMSVIEVNALVVDRPMASSARASKNGAAPANAERRPKVTTPRLRAASVVIDDAASRSTAPPCSAWEKSHRCRRLEGFSAVWFRTAPA
jgi:hypothetical protein